MSMLKSSQLRTPKLESDHSRNLTQVIRLPCGSCRALTEQAGTFYPSSFEVQTEGHRR